METTDEHARGEEASAAEGTAAVAGAGGSVGATRGAGSPRTEPSVAEDARADELYAAVLLEEGDGMEEEEQEAEQEAAALSTPPAVRVRRPIPAWPLVYYRVKPDNSAAEGDVLWPVFRYERQGDDESYRVRPFIYSRRKHLATGDWETDVLWPLFHNACTHDDVDGGHTTRFDIRPWLWSVARRYNAEGGLVDTDASALFCLVRYHADASSLDFAVHPWLLHYLRQVEDDPQERTSDEPAGTTDEAEINYKEGDDEESTTPAPPRRCAQSVRVELKLLGGLVEYLASSARLHLAMKPGLFKYDRDSTGKGALEVSVLAGLAKYSVGPWGEGHTDVVRTNTRLAPVLFRQSATGGDIRKGLPEYTVVFPLYFYVRDENTTRLHVWPVFGVQTFDDARVVEYSTLYPFFRYTTFAPTDDAATQHEQDKEFRVDALWPLIHYQKGPAHNLSHHVFPFYSYGYAAVPAPLESGDGSSTTADATSYHSKGHFLVYYWDSSYTLRTPDSPPASSASSSSSSTSVETVQLATAVRDEALPSFQHSWGLFPVCQRTLSDNTESLYLFPFISSRSSFQYVQEEVTEEEIEIIEADSDDEDESDSDDTESEDESEGEVDSAAETESDDESSEAEDRDDAITRRREAKGKGKATAEPREKNKKKEKEKRQKRQKVVTRKTLVQRTRMAKRESKSVFVPLLMAYYTRDDMAQSSAVYSPLLCQVSRGAAGDGWLLLPPIYFSRREQGGAAAGGSETRVLLPVFYRHQDNNSRKLAVLPFYADFTNLITNSRFQMRTPAWFKYHNGINGANHWWGFIPFPFYKHESNETYAFALFPFYGVVRDLINNSNPGSYAEAFTVFYYRFVINPNDPNLEFRNRFSFFVPTLTAMWDNHASRGYFTFFLPLLTVAFSKDEIQSRERYRFYMVVPLLNFWFSLSTPTEHIQILFPFFFRFREVLRHRVFVFPWFYYSHDLRNLDRRLVLSPFIVDDDCVQSQGSRTQWVFPFFYRSYTPGQSTFLCPLGLYRHNKDTGGSLLLTPMILDDFRPTAGVRNQWFLPVFFRRLWDDNEEVLLLPVYYHRHLQDQLTGAVHDTTAVVPFYMGTTHAAADGTLTYARHLLFFPVFRRIHAPGEDAISYDVLWPLAHYSRTPTSLHIRMLPLAWVYDDHAAQGSQIVRARAFFPLYYSVELGDARKLTAFFPFWLNCQGASGSVTVGTFGLLPPYYYRRIDEHGQTKSLHLWLLWPLFAYDEDADRGSVYMRFLLFLRTSRSQPSATGSAQLERHSFTSLLPLWFRQSSTDKETGVRDFSLLLHYYHATASKLELALGWLLHPALSVFYLKRTDDTLLHRLLAVYHYTWSRAGFSRLSLLWLFHPSAALILLSNDPDHTLAYIFAVFHYMRDKATGNFRLSFLWALHPALAMAAVTRELGRLRHHVFPFYHYSDDTNARTLSISFLYLMFPALALGQWRRCADSLRHYLMPFYFYKHEPAKATRQLSLLWLLNPQLALARWTTSNTETRARITGLWHYVRNQRSVQWSMLYPLVFPSALALIRYAHDMGGSTVHYAAPLYYYRNDLNRRRFALLYLLHPALSLFYYSRRDVSRLHPSIPQEVEVVHRLTPLYSYACTRDPAGQSTSQGDTVTHGVPLLYNYRSTPSESRLRFLCGLFSRVSKVGEFSHQMWPFYAYSNNSLTGVLRFTALFGLFLYQRDQQQRWCKEQLLVRLLPLFRYERNDANPAASKPASSQLSILWAFHPAFCLYRYFTNDSKTFGRMWPLYHFEEDKALQKRRLCFAYIAAGVSLIRHQKEGNTVENWVWPLVRATSAPKQPRVIDALWLLSKPRLSLFHYERDRNKLELWPLFSYAVDPATKEKRLRLLLTAVQYQATATAYDLKVLWRMMRVAREDDGSYSACINPLIYHEHSPTAGSWTAFLGGLIARETTPAGQSRTSYFWLF